MRNFTFSNKPFMGSGSCGFLLKGLLLFMAISLFNLNTSVAQEAVDAEGFKPTLESNSYIEVDPVQAELGYSNRSGALFNRSNVFVEENPDVDPSVNCPNLRITLLLDESGSILTREGVEQVREATLALAEVLLGTPANLRIVEFENTAREIELSDPNALAYVVTQTYIDNLTEYLYNEYDGQSYDPNSEGLNLPCPVGNTNWEAGLAEAYNTDPNLLIFLTDGEPTSFNTDQNPPCGFIVGGGSAPIDQATLQANVIREDGVHIFAYGVGNGINGNNIQNLIDVSGPDQGGEGGNIFTDDYSTGSFEELADNLSAGVNALCGTELAFTKSVDLDQICSDSQEVTFTLTVQNTGGNTDLEATNVIIEDEFLAAFQNLSIVEPVPAGATLVGQVLTYEVGNLAVGASASIQVTATIPGAAGDFTNVATADASNALEVEAEASVEKADEFTSIIDIEECGSFEFDPSDYVVNPEVETVQNFGPGVYMEVVSGQTESGCPLEVTVNILVIAQELLPTTVVPNFCGTYEWDVNGDGFYDEDTEPSYSESGSYTFALINDLGLCALASLDLTIIQAEEINEGVVTTCENEYTVFLEDGTEIITYDASDNGQINESIDFLGVLCVTIDLYLNIGDPGSPCSVNGDGVNDGLIAVGDDGECFCEPGAPDPCADAGGDTDGDGICDDNEVSGCTDMASCNYNPAATDDDGSCVFATEDCEVCENGAVVLQDADGDGICDNEEVSGCTDMTSCNYNPAATDDDSSCVFATEDCEVCENGAVVLQDADGDGICDNEEVSGCTDMTSCNYNPVATDDDGSCVFATEDCEVCENGAVVLQDADGDGICDNEEVSGCTDMTSCNYNPAATDDDGSCVFATEDCEVCENGAVVLQDADGDGICDSDDPCPQLADLENGDACVTGFGQAGIVEDCECVADNNPGGGGCEDWVVYQADILANGFTNIYAVTFDGSNANLELIASSDIEVHIAYNEIDNLIYAVSGDDGSYRTLNPHVENPEFSETTLINANVSQITVAAFNADGKLLIGSQTSDIIYCVNLVTNDLTTYDGYSPISGGDIAFGLDGRLYLATKKANGGLFLVNVDAVLPDQMLSSIPSLPTGMALSSSNQLLISSNSSSTLLLRDIDNGSNVGSFDLKLNGETFISFNGDMASGCNSFNDNVGSECNYKLFYTHSGPGAPDGLYGLTLNNDQTATVNFLTSQGGRHIALSPDGSLIYMVGGSNIQTYDVSTNTIINNVNVYNGANNANLSGFVAAVADSEGNVFIGGAGNNVWQVNPETGEALNVASGISVSGGDLIVAPTGLAGMDELWIITRNNNRFRRVLDPNNGSFTVNVPEINGAAVLENGNVLLANGDGDGEDGFIEVSLEDGSIVGSYDVELPVFNGDLAGGCTEGQNIVENGACYATEVLEYVEGHRQNGSGIRANRTDSSQALGMPEGIDAIVFVTLGYEGSITLAFDGAVPNGPGADLEFVETTFNFTSVNNYPEYADVLVSIDGVNYAFAGTIDHENRFINIDAVDPNIDYINFVKIVNNDDLSDTDDAYDLDGVIAIHNCEVVPPVNPFNSIESQSELSSFPNPTQGQSRVMFTTAETARTLVEVYDMNGRNVGTLFNQEAQQGKEYTLDFNGNNLPNGVYIYRLTTNKETIFEKFMIAR